MKRIGLTLLLMVLFLAFFLSSCWAAPVPLPNVDLSIRQTDEPQEVVDSLKLLVILTLLSLVPAFLILMTSFTRIVVVLSFVRNALATQQTPPNQVLIGLALFLTLFVMAPVYTDIKTNALDPYIANSISQIGRAHV